MTIAVIGSRGWSQAGILRASMDRLLRRYGAFRLVSGGARGADAEGAEWARGKGLSVTIHRPDYKASGRSAPTIRNWTIIGEADVVVAFWDGQSTGTRHALDCAVKLGKPAWVVTPCGEHYRYGDSCIHEDN